MPERFIWEEKRVSAAITDLLGHGKAIPAPLELAFEPKEQDHAHIVFTFTIMRAEDIG